MISKKITGVLTIITITIIMLSFTYSDPPHYKNLQALPKDISTRGLDSTMDHFCNSLKVTCGYCHVKDEKTNNWDDANDTKLEKQRAREMIRMTDTINLKFFPPDEAGNMGYKNISIRTVSCYTCHHGAQLPVSVPPFIEVKKSPWETK